MFTTLDRVKARLVARYSEPHRAYHGVAHLQAVLRDIDMARPELTNPDAVELAVWFHDAVLDPGSATNEADSAALLLAEMKGLASDDLLGLAWQFVVATAGHRVPEGLGPDAAADCAVMLDADLAVLGSDAGRYDDYARGIAAEYAPVVSDADYARGRAAFLAGMIERPRLFLTDRAHAALHAAAIGNMTRELRALRDTVERR